MPGLNQQGPMNQGPMTGKGRGVCGNTPMPGTPGLGRRRSGGRGGGFGRCRGFGQGQGWGRGYAPEESAATPPPVTRETLQQRADALEDELQAVKEELAKRSES